MSNPTSVYAMRDNEQNIEMKELKEASSQFSPKEIIWSFANDLNHSQKTHEGKHDVSLSQFKENGSYTLIIDGTEYGPETQIEVWEILREVEPKYTEYFEEVNSHYFKD